MGAVTTAWFHALRIPNWPKNLLCLLPFFVVLRMDFQSMGLIVLQFCLISSAGYLLNDVVDQTVDRINPKGKQRPIAEGVISEASACGAATVLIMFAFILGLFSGYESVLGLLVYIILSLVYSPALKPHGYGPATAFAVLLMHLTRLIPGFLIVDMAPSLTFALSVAVSAVLLPLIFWKQDLPFKRSGFMTLVNLGCMLLSLLFFKVMGIWVLLPWLIILLVAIRVTSSPEKTYWSNLFRSH